MKFVLLLLISSLAFSDGLLVTKTLSSKFSSLIFDSFSFDKGGTLSISASFWPNTSNPQLFVCPASLAYSLSPCSPESTWLSDCPILFFPLKPQTQTLSIPKLDFYRLLLANCTPGGSSIISKTTLKYHLLNPNNSELPVGSSPLPVIYPALNILWAALLAWWITINFISKSPMKNLMCVVIVSKAIVCVLSNIYWSIYADKGLRLDQLDYPKSLLYSISESSFICVLLLISKGWKITRDRLETAEMKAIFSVLVLLVLTLLLFSMYSEDYYFLTLMIMYFFMLPKIFTRLTNNMTILQTQANWLRDGDARYDISILEKKIKLFRSLKTAVIIYLGCILMINSLRVLKFCYWNWLNVSSNEMVSLAMVFVACYLVRPRQPGLFDLNPLWVPESNRYPVENTFVEPYDMSHTILVQWPSDMEELSPGVSGLALCVEDGTDDQILKAQLVQSGDT